MATYDGSSDEGALDERKAALGGGRWIGYASALMLLGGIAALLLPRFVPATASPFASLARHGVDGALVCGFGLVLAAVAAVAAGTRGSRGRGPLDAPISMPEREVAPSLADDPWAREMSSELARLRGGVHDLRVDFVYVKDALGRLQQSVAQSESGSGRDTEAAIFRLAASLDQLGGRIEHEIFSQRAWFADALERDARRPMAESAPLPRFADPYFQAFEGVGHEIHVDDGFVSAEDDIHVEVSLDDDTTWSAGLGVLDEIDEPRAPLANSKTSPSGRPMSSGGLLDELESGAADIEGKMAQLRYLLSDPGVQHALEARTR